MPQCTSKDHPDCRHECPGPGCFAIYEKETQLCYRGCDEASLSGYISFVWRKVGWRAITTADLVGLRCASVWTIAHFFRSHALEEVIRDPGSTIDPFIVDVLRSANDAIDAVANQDLFEARMPRVTWGFSNSKDVMSILARQVGQTRSMER